MKVETLPSGTRLVRRYVNGRCYAGVWSSDTTDKQVMSQMQQGEADFWPYNESDGTFNFGRKPRRFRR